MTESRANQLFPSVQDIFYENYKDEKGLKYLAVVKHEKKFGCFFEIGSGEEMLANRLKEIKNNIQRHFPEHPKFFGNIKSIRKQNYVYQAFKSSNIKTDSKVGDFNFHSNKKTFFGTALKCQRGSVKRGTIGAILELNDEDGLFFLTNHHVISKYGKEKGTKVYNLENEVIGEFHSSIYNDDFDVALIKITSSDYLMEGKAEFNFGKLKPPSFSIKKIMGKGLTSGHHKDKGYLYSSKAIVKIEDKWFKNQILLKGLGFEHGDSGSVIVEKKSTNKKQNVIGLYIGGNNNISVANNIFNLLSKPDTEKEPIINFKTFIN